MAHITQVLAVPAVGAYYYEDLAALHAAPMPIEQRYTATPVTAGFGHVREVAQAVSVGLLLDSGDVAWGDCVAVVYSGKAGRDPVFRTREGIATIQRTVAPALRGKKVTTFRELVAGVEELQESVEALRPAPRPEPQEEPGVRDPSRRRLLTAAARLLSPYPDDQEGSREKILQERITVRRRLHTAVRYGISQALLQAVAMTRGLTMAEVIAEEWGLPRPEAPVPIHAQSGSERYHNADKMIIRRVASLPHALVDDIPQQLGESGGELIRYMRWLKGRIEALGGEYCTIHLDLHGALGTLYHNNLGRVLGQMRAMELVANPYPLRIESPVIMKDREAQIEAMQRLCEYLRFRDMGTQLVVDEWANTLEDIQAFIQAQAAHMIQIKMPDLGGVQNAVEAVLACQAGDVGAFLGGSCAETDLSARVSVHVALATRPDIVMAKPGMGVDEAIMLTQNEMSRALAQIQARQLG